MCSVPGRRPRQSPGGRSPTSPEFGRPVADLARVRAICGSLAGSSEAWRLRLHVRLGRLTE